MATFPVNVDVPLTSKLLVIVRPNRVKIPVLSTLLKSRPTSPVAAPTPPAPSSQPKPKFEPLTPRKAPGVYDMTGAQITKLGPNQPNVFPGVGGK